MPNIDKTLTSLLLMPNYVQKSFIYQDILTALCDLVHIPFVFAIVIQHYTYCSVFNTPKPIPLV